MRNLNFDSQDTTIRNKSRLDKKQESYPRVEKEAFLAQINEQLIAGIIAPSSSPWSFPPRIKPNEQLWFTILSFSFLFESLINSI